MNELDKIKEGSYPIRVVTKMTGLTADVIRAWERRYGAITPTRSDGNTRMFSSNDIKRLMLLKAVTEKGHSIKQIANLDDKALKEMAGESPPVKDAGAKDESVQDERYAEIQEEYLSAIHRFDGKGAFRILSRAAVFIPSHEFIFHFALPVMRKVGHNWEKGEFSVAHEHLVSMQMRTIMVKMMDLHSSQPGSRRILVTTPDGHHHEFGALVGALIAAGRGMDPVYLGPSLPEEDIEVAIDVGKADVLLLGLLLKAENGSIGAFNEMLARLSQKVEIWVGLPEDHPAMNAVKGVKYLSDFDQLDLALTKAAS